MSATYDAQYCQPRTERLFDGTEFFNTYDDHGNRTQRNGPLGYNVQMRYDAKGNMIEHIDSKASSTSYTYNQHGSVTIIENALGYKTTFQYDGAGRLIKTTDPSSFSMEYTYDHEDNVILIIDELGNETGFKYDKNNNLIEKKDPKGNITLFGYDGYNNLSQITDATGNLIFITHEMKQFLINGRQGWATVIDANSNLTSRVYNNLMRLNDETDAVGYYKKYTYDGVGNILTREDGNGNTTNYSYDSLNRLTQKSYPDGSSVTYSYDAMGRLTEMTDSSGTYYYTYDALGRLTDYVDAAGRTLVFSYDEVGNLIALNYPEGNQVTYKYDALNRLTQVEDWAGRKTEYHYDERDLISQTNLSNVITIMYEYDNAGKILELSHERTDGSIIASFSYVRDVNGNIVSETAQLPIEPVFEKTDITYTYGPDNQLLEIQTGSDSRVACQYDGNGNMISKGDTTLKYNYENKLIEYKNHNGKWEFGYNGLGNRIWQKFSGVETHFLIDPRGMTQVLVECDRNSKINSYFLYGLGLVSKIDAFGNSYYYHFNHKGDTIALTDKNGNIFNESFYSPFGVLQKDNGTIDNPFRYVGRFGAYHDANNLYYLRARYYDAHIGLFLIKDPIGFEEEYNLYKYCRNDPINLIDPSGLKTEPGDDNGNEEGTNKPGYKKDKGSVRPTPGTRPPNTGPKPGQPKPGKPKPPKPVPPKPQPDPDPYPWDAFPGIKPGPTLGPGF